MSKIGDCCRVKGSYGLIYTWKKLIISKKKQIYLLTVKPSTTLTHVSADCFALISTSHVFNNPQKACIFSDTSLLHSPYIIQLTYIYADTYVIKYALFIIQDYNTFFGIFPVLIVCGTPLHTRFLSTKSALSRLIIG